MSKRLIRHSGLQKEILKLYKDLLREAEKKPQNSNLIKSRIRSTFLNRKGWPVRDVDTIESWVKTGNRNLRSLQNPGFSGFSQITIKRPSDLNDSTTSYENLSTTTTTTATNKNNNE